MRQKRPFLHVMAIFYTIVSLVPTFWMVSGSLKSQNDFNQYPPSFIPQQMHFENFTKLFNSFHFDVYLKNTIFVTVAIVLLSLLVNSMAAYALARLTFPGRNIIFLFVLGSMMIPFATYMIPLFMVIRQLGLINNLWGIVVIAIAHPFSIFLLRQFYMNFPKELEEAGRIDGLGLIGIFFRLIVPTSKPIFTTVGLLVFIWNWNNYVWPLIVTNDKSLWVLQLGITSFMSEHSAEFQMVMAGSLVAILPIVVLFFSLQRYLIEGILSSGIKG
ncbi:carbohydrate ABC transporter permease [Paenibacillus alba]|uniref:carbohydrate ABC transporter permease n=1 Tax=Paenibacillus alba TaxID=1197127 RepID=UPI0015641498|nr:carbohydrate ABC transporter permease [Paenibacillus alba]NQX67232.1 carbohydrate ABC transporter permease [Paenibacillus alba]